MFKYLYYKRYLLLYNSSHVVANDGAEDEGHVEAVAVLLAVALLECADNVTSSPQVGDNSIFSSQNVTVHVYTQTSSGEVVVGVNAAEPDTLAGVDVGKTCAAPLVCFTGESELVVLLDGSSQVGQVQSFSSSLYGIVVDSFALLEDCVVDGPG